MAKKKAQSPLAAASPKSGQINRQQIDIKLGSYGVCPASAIVDPGLLPRVQDYKRQTASRMIPLDRREITKRIPTAEYHASRKVDGEFTVLVYRDGDVFTVNPGGTVRVGLPFMAEAEKLLRDAGIAHAVICGELCVEHADGRRERVHDVIRFARAPESQTDLDQLHFRCFDWLEIDGAAPTNYAEAWQRLQKIFEHGQRCRPVDTTLAKNASDVEKLFTSIVETDGAEGLVLRSETAGSFKIKPRYSLDAAVIGFTESTGDRVGMMHDLLLAVMRADGALHVLCRVGGGFTDDLRRELLADLKDRVVSSEYAEVNSDHVAYQMVEPRWVAEISCLDLVSQSTRGAPIQRMTLDWDAAERRYRVIRRLPLVSVISPQFVRMRDDKRVSVDDVRIAQVADLVEVPMLDRDAHQMTLPSSEVMAREVYSKQLKGETMVRKFVMWKTNKSDIGEEYPAYVIHYTDYSPNRATPLAREVRVSNSAEQIQQLWDDMKAENIKKGWEKR
ncbi:MAG: ATP-dependent DNA ligase [Pirellulaceae bacterium]|nr:ATP-dependent DNA ligase [Pirellulaceae bacterium]